MVFNVVVKNI